MNEKAVGPLSGVLRIQGATLKLSSDSVPSNVVLLIVSTVHLGSSCAGVNSRFSTRLKKQCGNDETIR